MTKYQLCEQLGIKISYVDHNFKLLVRRQLKKGNLIKRSGSKGSFDYTISKIDRSADNLPNEKWVDCCVSKIHEVSNLGRIRRKDTHTLLKGELKNGYVYVGLKQKESKWLLHRLVKQSFEPKQHWENWTVDHINGIRNDNRLENLRWMQIEVNVKEMMMNRAPMEKELTRLINKYGYKQTLQKLKQLE